MSVKTIMIPQVSGGLSGVGMSEVLKGVVKWFNNSKGFGFIEHTSGKDVFVHYSVIESDGYRSLKDGEMVEYEVKEGPKGFHATRVHRPNGSADAQEDSNGSDPAHERKAIDSIQINDSIQRDNSTQGEGTTPVFQGSDSESTQ